MIIVKIEDDGNGNLTFETIYENGEIVFNNSYSNSCVKKPCYYFARSTMCRTSIEGKIIWIDNNNANNTRPDSIEITLLRDGEIYKTINVDSSCDGTFIFCCVPIGKNPYHKYV